MYEERKACGSVFSAERRSSLYSFQLDLVDGQIIKFSIVIYYIIQLNMSKRRTRKEKEKAVHTYTFKPVVNGQSKSRSSSLSGKNTLNKNALDLAQDDTLASTKRGLIRSLIIISFVLALELVIYSVFK